MMQAILFDNGEGGVGIVYPVAGCGLTIEEIAAKDVPAGAEFAFVEVTELDRTFRAAWTYDNGLVRVDMPTAREIHKTRMRAARKPVMAALDVEYMRADENDDKAAKAEIAAKKQALRDVTINSGIAAAKTPNELKAVWPEMLEA